MKEELFKLLHEILTETIYAIDHNDSESLRQLRSKFELLYIFEETKS